MYSIISYKSTFSHALFHQQGLIGKEVIIQVIKEHDQSKPLFLYIPIQSVHNPYEVPDKYKEVILKRSRLCMLTHTLLTVFGGGGYWFFLLYFINHTSFVYLKIVILCSLVILIRCMME